jgi:hypothetical protein
METEFQWIFQIKKLILESLLDTPIDLYCLAIGGLIIFTHVYNYHTTKGPFQGQENKMSRH